MEDSCLFFNVFLLKKKLCHCKLSIHANEFPKQPITLVSEYFTTLHNCSDTI